VKICLKRTQVHEKSLVILYGKRAGTLGINGTCLVVQSGAVLCADKDFEPLQQDSSDDEETIEKDERDHKNVSFSSADFCLQPAARNC